MAQPPDDLNAYFEEKIGVAEPRLRAVPSENGTGEKKKLDYRDRLLTITQLRTLPPPRSLISGVIDLDSIAFLYGARGSYKSFIGIDMGSCIATGTRWHGREVEQGNVLMVAAEGVGGLAARFDAWQAVHPFANLGDNFHVLPEAVNLLAPSSVGLLAEAAGDLNVRLVILDTLARCLIGGDENSAKDGGLAVEQMDSIRVKTGACVMPIAHVGKNAEAGVRGTSAFEGAADTLLEVRAGDGTVTIYQEKQKNHIAGNPIRLHAELQNESVILTQRDQSSGELPPGVLLTLAALSEIMVTGGVASGAWLLSSTCSEATFYRHRAGLINHGLVSNVGTEKQPRYQVTDAGALTLSEHSQGLS